MKVKMIIGESANDIENRINDFIEEIEKENMEVKDIKYSTTSKGYKYSALVMYGLDGKLYLNLGNSLSEAEYNDEFGR